MKKVMNEMYFDKKVAAADISLVLSNEIIRKKSEGSIDEADAKNKIFRIIEETFYKSRSPLYTHVENKIQELLPDSMVDQINEILKANNARAEIEGQIKDMRWLLEARRNENPESITKPLNLQMEIEIKEDELRLVGADFLKLYKAALTTTTVSAEFYDMVMQLADARSSFCEFVDSEIDLLKAKIEVLKMIRRATDSYEVAENILSTKVPLDILSVASLSKTGEPIIKALIR